MIEINGELCYSPQPPASYGRGIVGHGPLCRGDLQLWNLIFLSDHMLDEYLAPAPNIPRIMLSVSPMISGSAMALLEDSVCERFFPNVRDALKLTPRGFFDELCKVNQRTLPQIMLIPDWLNTVTERVIMFDPMVIKREGNILHGNFGRAT